MENELQIQINRMAQEIEKLKKNTFVLDHFHNGFDTSRINFSDVYQKKIWVHHTVIGADAATAANYGTFFIAPFVCTVNSFKEIHQVAGSDAGAVTLDLERLSGTTAPDSGTAMLDSTLSLKATANTLQTATLSATVGNRNLAIGDRLCLKDAGVLTNVSNVSVIVELLLL
jgi:hypothetical protein